MTTNRKDKSFYWPFYAGMLLPAAEALQKREFEVKRMDSEPGNLIMQPFLTWSGSASHEIALFFKGWLTEVLPGFNLGSQARTSRRGRNGSLN